MTKKKSNNKKKVKEKWMKFEFIIKKFLFFLNQTDFAFAL